MDELDLAFDFTTFYYRLIDYIHLYFQESVYNAACQYSCFSHINVHCF